MTSSNTDHGGPRDDTGSSVGDAPLEPHLPAPGVGVTAAPRLSDASHHESPVTQGGAVPYLPAPTPVVVEPAPEPEFDAKAMVDSQKRYNPKPAYGEMPTATAESRDAAKRLRAEANRKRRRGKLAGRVVLVVLLAGLAVGGYFVYRALQDGDTDDVDIATPADADDTGDSGNLDGALSPAGEQVLVLDGLDTLNDTASPSAGGLLGAIDEARAAVDAANGASPDATQPAAPPPALTADVILPPVLVSTSTRLIDQDGFELYRIDTAAFQAADGAAFARFLETLVAQPQVDSPVFGLFPDLAPGEIGLAVQRGPAGLARVVAVSPDGALRVDTTQ
jgi:hypothetical protein